ncbi:FixH family protein [Flexithrix dorotheae]|uniref:FixH family protein n=1 Tax=Flexithrix dorotheae TaxID=70993 RepID=UPI0003634532|nr:FixH family protein [Flexithrix dorotheae]
MKKFNWGHGITVFFIFFVISILWAIFSSTRENIHLVSENYYAEELVYEERIQRIKNTSSLSEHIEINTEKGSLALKFPPELIRQDLSGTITLFRPSNSNYDKNYSIALDSSGKQVISVSNMVKGMYKVKIDFSTGVKAYYFEEKVYLN